MKNLTSSSPARNGVLMLYAKVSLPLYFFPRFFLKKTEDDDAYAELVNRGQCWNRTVHVLNVEIRDNHEDAMVGGRMIQSLAEMVGVMSDFDFFYMRIFYLSKEHSCLFIALSPLSPFN